MSHLGNATSPKQLECIVVQSGVGAVKHGVSREISATGLIGHNINRLWRPAAAMTMARLAISWPRTSAKSSSYFE
jgi:hypothetical protein